MGIVVQTGLEKLHAIDDAPACLRSGEVGPRIQAALPDFRMLASSSPGPFRAGALGSVEQRNVRDLGGHVL
jgi:hypothetical protein